MQLPPAYEAVLFDLDGTLVDTAPDMAAALNALRVEEGLPPLPYEAIKPVVSHGGVALIKLAFDITPEHADFDRLRQRFLDLYEADIAQHTSLFAGIQAVLDHLTKQGIIWGIITNKPGWLTDPLLEQLAIQPAPACIVSGDTTAHAKPHPAPMLHACELINREATNCLYLGDAERDIEAGNAVNMTTVAVKWGYLSADDKPEAWQADYVIEHPDDIIDLLHHKNTSNKSSDEVNDKTSNKSNDKVIDIRKATL